MASALTTAPICTTNIVKVEVNFNRKFVCCHLDFFIARISSHRFLPLPRQPMLSSNSFSAFCVVHTVIFGGAVLSNYHII